MKVVNSEMQVKPRYKSVIRNDLQINTRDERSLNPSPMYPNSNSVQDVEPTQRRTLERKRATNDLYTRIGEQITQTPRKQMDGLMKLPTYDMAHHGQYMNQQSIQEESLQDLHMNHQDSLTKRSSLPLEKSLNGGGNNDMMYYDFITNSSVEMFEHHQDH